MCFLLSIQHSCSRLRMRAVVEGIIQTVVHEALHAFGDLLPNEPQRRHFAGSSD